MVARSVQVLTMDMDLMSIRNPSYVLLDLYSETPLAKDLFPGPWIGNYWDPSQNEWFVKEYVKQLDANKEKLVAYWERFFTNKPSTDLILGGYECTNKCICHRHVLKHWLCEFVDGLYPGGDLTGKTIEFDVPKRCVVNTDLDTELVKLLVGCQILVEKPEQAESALKQMLKYHSGPIVNLTGTDLDLGVDTYEAKTEAEFRKHLWKPLEFYLMGKEKNDVDKIYAKIRSAI